MGSRICPVCGTPLRPRWRHLFRAMFRYREFDSACCATAWLETPPIMRRRSG